MQKSFSNIDLSRYQSEYRNPRDIATALAWNAVKKTLTELGRDDLFPYIKSIKITEKEVIIKTGKPIVNSELIRYQETLSENLHKALTALIP